MRDLLVFAIVFALLPLALARTPVGILLWNWIGFMNPHRLGWGSAYYFRFGEVIAGVTLISFIFSKDKKMIPLSPLVITLLCFIAWMNITTYYALVPADALHQWQKVMKIQLFILIALSCMQARRHIKQLLWVVTLSIAYFGVKGGLFTLLQGGNYLVLGPRGSQIEDNNTLAVALIMILPLMVYLSKQVKYRFVKWGLLAACILCGFSILGSHSRGALLAASAMMLFLIFKSQRKLLITVVMLISIPIGVHFMPTHWFERMHTIQTYQEDASAMGRINAWHFAFNLAKDRPMVGGGFETFRPGLFQRYAPVPEDYHDAHSIYFEVLGEQGFMGLFLYLGILLFAWLSSAKTQRLTRNSSELKWAYDLSAMLQVSLIGYMVGGAFLGIAYFDLFYMLVVFVTLTRHYVEQQVNQQLMQEQSQFSIQGVEARVPTELRKNLAQPI